jgi:branched-chain amino acid transport system permease protein
MSVSQTIDGADFGARIKEAAGTAVLTVLLCMPIILFHAEADNDGVLYPIPRPWAVAIFALLAFFGRLAALNFSGGVKKETKFEVMLGWVLNIVLGLAALLYLGYALWAMMFDLPFLIRLSLSGMLATLIFCLFCILLLKIKKYFWIILSAITKYLPIIGLAALFLYPFVILALLGSGGSLKWVDTYGIQILIYVMLGWGLNIVVGLAGLLDLGYAAFYAVGAYSYALLATTFGLSFWICLPLAGMLAALWGVMLGFPVLRLRGDYLAIVTLAFGEIIRMVLVNWVSFTGGGAGIASIPKITFFSLRFADQPDGFDAFFHLDYSPLHGKMFLYYVILCLALITNLVSMQLRRLPIGRAWEALREDEIACRSLGVNTTNTKLTAFALGAFFGGLAGSFFAVRQGFISPESFTFTESATILAIVVLGGMGSQIGVAFAAVFLIGGFELLRELDVLRAVMSSGAGVFSICLAVVVFGLIRSRRLAALVAIVLVCAVVALWSLQLLPNVIFDKFAIPNFDPAQYRGLLFGLAMVVMMVVRPRGLISTRSPSIFLREKRAVSGSLVKEGRV